MLYEHDYCGCGCFLRQQQRTELFNGFYLFTDHTQQTLFIGERTRELVDLHGRHLLDLHSVRIVE
jgi:hypothetical protein